MSWPRTELNRRRCLLLMPPPSHRRSKAVACRISRTLFSPEPPACTCLCLRGKHHRERLSSTASEAYQRPHATAIFDHLYSRHLRLYLICHNGSPTKKPWLTKPRGAKETLCKAEVSRGPHVRTVPMFGNLDGERQELMASGNIVGW